MDIFEKCGEFTIAKEAMQAGFYPYFIALAESEGTEAVYKGRRLIMCGSNNYLGLTTHPKVREAAVAAINLHSTARYAVGTLRWPLPISFYYSTVSPGFRAITVISSPFRRSFNSSGVPVSTGKVP